MNRRKIFAWIAGALGIGVASAEQCFKPGGCDGSAAQSNKSESMASETYECTTVAGTPCPPFLEWKAGKPANGQCPVCGTMAAAGHWDYDIDKVVKEHPDYGKGLDLSRQQKHVRCLKCNAAFYQDVARPRA